MPPSQADAPVIGFMHIATIGRWQQVVEEQLSLLHTSGVWDRLSSLRVGIVGSESTTWNIANNKITIVHRSPSLDEYEFPTLAALHAVCAYHAGNVFYIHTKGVSRDAPCTNDWRKYLEYFAIERYQDCLAALQTHDICGVDWHLSPWPHFSGNFWWATADYVASLSSPIAMQHAAKSETDRRLCAEQWIGSGPRVRAACLHNSDVDHYQERYPRSRYARADVVTSLAQPNHNCVAITYDDQLQPNPKSSAK